MKPKKSQEDKWVELRKLGKIGEKFIEEYLSKQGCKLMPLNLNTMSDDSHQVMEWEELKKYPKIPDFIAKKEEQVFLFDVKTKRKYDYSAYKFLVNVRDYQHYLKFLKICSVKIYFVFINHKNKILSLFVHDVKERDYPVSIEWDKNKVYDVSEYKEQLE